MRQINRIFVVISCLGMLIWLMLVWDRPWYMRISDQDLEVKGGSFTLLSTQGKVSLTDFRDKIVILYFGYTFCPDVCPTSLTMISNSLNYLTTGEKEQVQALFITVDPQRDTLSHMDEYLKFFNPRIIALTGNETEIAQIAKQYGIVYRRSITSSSEGGDYLMDHSAATYLINKQGRLIKTIPYEAQAIDLADEIKKLL